MLVAIERSFGGTLVGTLLGNAVSVQARGPDFVALGLTMALAAVSVADVLYLNLRERSQSLRLSVPVGGATGNSAEWWCSRRSPSVRSELSWEGPWVLCSRPCFCMSLVSLCSLPRP